MSNEDDEIKQLQEQRKRKPEELTKLSTEYTGSFDSDIYGTINKNELARELYDVVEDNDLMDEPTGSHPSTLDRLRKTRIAEEVDEIAEMRERGGSQVNTKISSRQGDYHTNRVQPVLSPERGDEFSDSTLQRSYKATMKSKMLDEEEERTYRMILEQKEEKERLEREREKRMKVDGGNSGVSSSVGGSESLWGATPKREENKWEMPTPTQGSMSASKWDETPVSARFESGGMSDTPSRKRSRWDETPSASAFSAGMTPGKLIGGPEITKQYMWQREMEYRNLPMTDEQLDSMLPAGYVILDPPANYHRRTHHSINLMATPTPLSTPGFSIGSTPTRDMYGVQTPVIQDVPLFERDQQLFSELLTDIDESKLSKEEARDRKIMILLIKIKNGTPAQRKSALRQITEGAVGFGAGPLFHRILSLLLSTDLESQERHLLIKVVDRVLFKLDALVRPYVHKILVAVEPMLIDDDYYARVEGREVISNLAKAAGLAVMLRNIKPDLDDKDDRVRNMASRALAVVASALGIQKVFPFLKAVCQSKKSMLTRHTGIQVIKLIANDMGCAVLPHLNHLVSCIKEGLNDSDTKIRTITGLALAGLAEASYPFGMESFDEILSMLMNALPTIRGKQLAAYLKAVGFIIPLMDDTRTQRYMSDVVNVLVREFATPDIETRNIVVKVVKQCVQSEAISSEFIRENICPDFFKNMWNRRGSSDRKNTELLIDCTYEIACRVGVSHVLDRLIKELRDESEWYRDAVMNAIQKILSELGSGEVSTKTLDSLMDGLLFAFQEQAGDNANAVINCFGTVLRTFGKRSRPYLYQISNTLMSRIHNKNSNVRMHAADLIARIAPTMKMCEEIDELKKLGSTLFEYLGEEYPEVLGSILNGLKSIVNVMGMDEVSPPIRDLLPALVPILRNRHEKVQENCVDLVGRIADRGASHVSEREWIRICIDLLELLNAKKKSIRRATVNIFGYIAYAIGPQDTIIQLLNNLKVQERQNRVCTSIAIAIVAESCGPYTVLPVLMNEYRLPEMNVQNGVLKSLSFMYEYIGEAGSNYLYPIITLLEDALLDRDLIHRQQACSTISHLATGVYGLGCEDGITHLLNYVFPNIFETSPHLNKAVLAAIEACRLSLGAPVILLYILQGLFHPARRVREIYWKIYNNLYIYACDSLTMAYPRMDDDAGNVYRRDYIEMFI